MEVSLKFSGSSSRVLKPELARYYNHPETTFCVGKLEDPITKELFDVIQKFKIQHLDIKDIALLRNAEKPLKVTYLRLAAPKIENYDFSKMPLRKIEMSGSIDLKSFSSLPISVETIVLGKSMELSDKNNYGIIKNVNEKVTFSGSSSYDSNYMLICPIDDKFLLYKCNSGRLCEVREQTYKDCCVFDLRSNLYQDQWGYPDPSHEYTSLDDYMDTYNGYGDENQAYQD
ncbi:unnamed protein product [Ambrosiozyma monospora]|uniref:Unnamed protein product n=1 Tax=Ambrosiozyma monospora TaxID=43982 RepID=A0ACB5TK80_AMBMO|nr:unnamed protein product [Ambrosiozyma monospora]